MTAAEVEEAPPPDDASLRKIAALAMKQLDIERAIADAEAHLVALNGQLKNVSEVELPAAMDAAHTRAFTTDNGTVVSVDTYYQANVPSAERVKDAGKLAALLAKRSAWFKWLRANGHASLIKREVTVAFGKGEDVQAAVLLDLIKKGFSKQKVTDKEQVHTGSLQALVREQMEERGVVFPDELGVAITRRASVEVPE